MKEASVFVALRPNRQPGVSSSFGWCRSCSWCVSSSSSLMVLLPNPVRLWVEGRCLDGRRRRRHCTGNDRLESEFRPLVDNENVRERLVRVSIG